MFLVYKSLDAFKNTNFLNRARMLAASTAGPFCARRANPLSTSVVILIEILGQISTREFHVVSAYVAYADARQFSVAPFHFIDGPSKNRFRIRRIRDYRRKQMRYFRVQIHLNASRIH
jgi:hypothetical protein